MLDKGKGYLKYVKIKIKYMYTQLFDNHNFIMITKGPLENAIDISIGKCEKFMVFYSNIYVNFPP